jgi:hypothetical protein
VIETWLNNTVSDQEILHPGFSIFRKDRKERSGGGVLIAVKTDSFRTVKEFSPDGEDLQKLEIVSTELRTVTNRKILYCCCYRPPDADQCWMDRFKTYLQTICDLYENIIIAGDFNLPNIHWDTMENTTGVNELVFVRLLNDHYLSQLNNTPTRGNNILDLVITNTPDHVSLTQILSPEETSMFTDHHTISFDFSAFLKQPRKSARTIYDYSKGDMDALCAALGADYMDRASPVNRAEKCHENLPWAAK